MPTEVLEHLSQKALEGYTQLSPSEQAAVHNHVGVCEECRLRFKQQIYRTEDEKAEAGKRKLKLLALARDVHSRSARPHLSPEEFSAYLDGALAISDKRRTDAHLSQCSDCTGVLTELRPAEIKPTTTTTIERFSTPAFRIPRYAYAFGIVALVLGFSVIVFLRSEFLASYLASKRTPKHTVNPVQQLPDGGSNQAKETPQPDQPGKQTQEGLPQPSNNYSKRNKPSSTELVKAGERPPKLNNQLNDAGSVIGIDSEGQVAGLESAPASFQQAARQALDGKFDVPQEIANLHTKGSDETRSANISTSSVQPIMPLSPLDKVIRTDRPTFKWLPVSGVSYYIVTIFTESYDPVVKSGKLTETNWTVTRPLVVPAKYYKWQVEGYDVKGEDAAVRSYSSWIKVLDPEKDRELRNAEKTYSKHHLLLGSLYARAGLLDEAEREFRLLLRANPKSPVAQQLLRSVQEKKQGSSSKE